MWKKGVRFRLQKLGLNLLAACCLLPVIFLLANSLCVGGTVSLTQYEDILLYQRPFYVWFWNSAAYTAYSTVTCALPSGPMPWMVSVMRASVSKLVRRCASTTGSGINCGVSLQA